MIRITEISLDSLWRVVIFILVIAFFIMVADKL